MNLPYYFQYDIVKCNMPSECECPERHPHIDPIPLRNTLNTIILNTNEAKAMWSQNIVESMEETRLQHSYNSPIANGIEPCWTHCLSKISETLWWDIWYISYEVGMIIVYHIYI